MVNKLTEINRLLTEQTLQINRLTDRSYFSRIPNPNPDPPLPDVEHPDDDGDDVLAEEVLRDERVHQAGVAERLAGV